MNRRDFIRFAGGKAEFHHRLLHKHFARGIGSAEFFDLLMAHTGVGHDFAVAEPAVLYRPCLYDVAFYCSGIGLT
jgi:hypothetical protein